jgi:hypothetical protein
LSETHQFVAVIVVVPGIGFCKLAVGPSVKNAVFVAGGAALAINPVTGSVQAVPIAIGAAFCLVSVPVAFEA